MSASSGGSGDRLARVGIVLGILGVGLGFAVAYLQPVKNVAAGLGIVALCALTGVMGMVYELFLWYRDRRRPSVQELRAQAAELGRDIFQFCSERDRGQPYRAADAVWPLRSTPEQKEAHWQAARARDQSYSADTYNLYQERFVNRAIDVYNAAREAGLIETQEEHNIRDHVYIKDPVNPIIMQRVARMFARVGEGRPWEGENKQWWIPE